MKCSEMMMVGAVNDVYDNDDDEKDNIQWLELWLALTINLKISKPIRSYGS